MLNLQVLNCFWLTIPVLVWNAAFTRKLPQGYSSDARVPRTLLTLEHALRVLVFGLAILLPLRVDDLYGRAGLAVYVAGMLIYWASWVMQICFQDTRWSRSALGILAPAYTALIWLAGIALIGHSLVYALISILFTFVHTWHNVMVFGFQ
jgi:hypothetical protein